MHRWRRSIGYDRTAPRRPVNMSLNVDLVRRARRMTSNLSETVESLLAAFTDKSEAKAAEREIVAHIAANDAFVANYGSLANEFNRM